MNHILSKSILILLSIVVFTSTIVAQQVTTYAGFNTGYIDGTVANAKFRSPFGLAFDASGNLFISDHLEDKIRKITPAGDVTTFAGSTTGFADGTAFNAKFESLGGIAFDASGNLYVADIINARIRKISPFGDVSTFAGSGELGYLDGAGSVAKFFTPYCIAFDPSGNLYVTDYNNHRIRKISPSGQVSTFAGSGVQGNADGNGIAAQFTRPTGIACDAIGNVYVTDFGNHRIRKITPAGEVSTLAGSTSGYTDGMGISAQFNFPYGIMVDPLGNVFVTDYGNNVVRKITPAGLVSTVAGSGISGYADGDGTVAKFSGMYGIVMNAAGDLFIGDFDNHRVRKISMQAVTTGNLVSTQENSITIYPSPATNSLTLKSTEEITSFEVIDVTGQKVQATLSSNNSIDISLLNEGMYYIKLQIADRTEIHKFLKTN